MNKLKNESTVTTLAYPTTSTGKSASATFVDMSKYANAIVTTNIHKLPDAKGEGVATITVYEHTQSTWAGVATAVTAGVVTATVNSVSDVMPQIELRATDLSVNNSKRYINTYITLPTGAQIAQTVTRYAPRFESQV